MRDTGADAARQPNATRAIGLPLARMPLDKLFRDLKLSDNAIDIRIGTEVSDKDGKKAKLTMQISLTIAALLLLIYLLYFL